MISILIPTYNRPGKLLRLLRGLNLFYSMSFAKEQHSSLVPPIAEILIADGSDKQADQYTRLINSVEKELSMLSGYVDVDYMPLEGYTLNNRLFQLSCKAKSTYVMPMGDDDFPVIENLDLALKEIQASDCVSAVSGRLVNIRGISQGSLGLSILERPYSGFSLGGTCILSRISSHRVLNALGIPALFYSLQSKADYIDFTDLLLRNEKDLYYGGQEFLHQLHCCVSGTISFIEAPMVFRDFTYWGYRRESMREAPDSDPYPYYGIKAINMACEMLVNASIFASSKDALSYINFLIGLGQDISRSREYLLHPDIDSTMMSLYAENIPSCSLKAVSRAWLGTLQECYELQN